jgi:secreted trypsin-like serine protease
MRDMEREFQEDGTDKIFDACKISNARWDDLATAAHDIYKKSKCKSHAIRLVMEMEKINNVTVTEKERLCVMFVMAHNSGRISAIEDLAMGDEDVQRALDTLREIKTRIENLPGNKPDAEPPVNRLGRWN